MNSGHLMTREIGEIRELEKELRELQEINPRRAAEIAYVLARLFLNRGKRKKATQYGRESIRLFDQCKMETEEDCAAIFVTLAGIALPDLIHQKVVRNRLEPLKL